jgi:hypothetical protein
MKLVASLRGIVEAQGPLHKIGPKTETGRGEGVFFVAGGRAVVADVESAESASSPEPDGVGVRRDSYRLETPATRGEGRGGYSNKT